MDVPRDLTGPKLWINKKWIDEAGLDMPETVDDLYTILTAFKERDPNIIPVGSSGLDDIKYGLMGAFGYLGNNILNVVDDKVVFVPETDEYKEFLIYMNKLYSEGLLDQETFIQDTQQLNAKGQNMQLGMFMDAGAFLKVPEEESWDYVVLPPLTSSVNDEIMWPSTSGIVQGAFAITDKNPYPEATMRWVDYFYSEEGSIFVGTTGGSNGLLFTPYIVGERTPHADAAIRGSFIGMDSSHERKHFARAVLEGITFSLNESIEIFREHGKKIDTIVSIGGGAKNEDWLQIQADIFNAEIILLSSEQGPGMGAAMLAAYGCGWFDSLQACADEFLTIDKLYQPNPDNVKKYQKLFAIYQEITEKQKS